MMPRFMVRSAPLGRLLLDTGVLTQVQLDEVLVVQRTDRRRLGDLVVERGLVHPLDLAQLLSHQLSCPWISLAHLEITPEVLAALPEEVATAHGVIPVHLRVSKGQRVLYVATDDPTDEVALAECAAAAGMPVRPMVAISGEVRSVLARIYGATLRPESKVERPPPEAHPAPAERPKPPPLPAKKKEPAPVARMPSDVVELAPEKTAQKRAPTVLALNAPDGFLTQCRAAVASLGATLVDGGIVRAGELVAEHRPCAIIVTDDVYAFDRSGLNRLALDNDAHLVVWSEEVDARQLEPLLAGAIDRWGRSSYEKGAIVDGRYELLRDLGGEAASPTSSRWVVRNVRTARRSLLALAVRAEGEENVAAIRREQKALARITHPGAVELRDAGTTELGDPYIVLEPLEGRTLDGLVAARTKLVPDDVCAVVVQVAEVLAAAHAVGVVHRHVVPENIVITRDGYGVERVKLVGWGRAAVSDPALVEPNEDLVALAICAFESLTGRSPTLDETGEGALPETLLPLVTRALATEGGGFTSAKELSSAFQAAAPRARECTRLLDAAPRAREVPSGRPPPSASEQRRWARAPYRTPVRIEVPGIGAVDGRSEDISGGGLLVVSRGSLKAGTEVTVRFALPLDGRVVSERAIIKWSRAARSDDKSGPCAIGVELTAISPEALRQIDRYTSLMGEADS